MNLFEFITHDENNNTIYYDDKCIQLDTLSKIGFGRKICSVTFENNQNLGYKIKIPKNISSKLYFPNLKFKLKVYIQDDTLYIGPLIGIFTAGFADSDIRPIGDRSLFFSKLLSSQDVVGCAAYIFGAHSIDWGNCLIEGYVYDRNGWMIIKIPFPNVVYDRLPNRKTENHRLLQRVKDRFTIDYKIPWFNPGFFNKGEINSFLEKIDSVKRYLPSTIKHPTLKQIDELLDLFPALYLKPENGSLGNGVIKLWYSNEEQAYYCKYSDEEKNNVKKFDNLETLITVCIKDRSLSRYIVQQSISLIRENKQPIDFRVHTNKDEKGEWLVTAIAAKIAGKGSPTTHIKNGGYVKTIDELNISPEKKLKYEDMLISVSLLISRELDKKFEGLIGELGFDLGIDVTDDVWFFEANSKPGRSIFHHPKLLKNDNLTRECSLLYATYLAEKSFSNHLW
jgi:hypothetical protein